MNSLHLHDLKDHTTTLLSSTLKWIYNQRLFYTGEWGIERLIFLNRNAKLERVSKF
jgi:hypothetical protein